jgi:hypothetical protein
MGVWVEVCARFAIGKTKKVKRNRKPGSNNR